MDSQIKSNQDYNWVFAYGSLMWRPNFSFIEVIPAHIDGWHRDMCIISIHYRGTSDVPGLVSGLRPGGSCQGRAYRISDRDIEEVIKYLDERELITNVYLPEKKEIILADDRVVKARVYISNLSHEHYVGHLSLSEKVNYLMQVSGSEGRSIDYLSNIIDQLNKLKIEDEGLIEVMRLYQDRIN